MSLRPADALAYASFKAELIESDHEAVFSDGHREPIYYRVKDGKQELLVEVNYQWFRTSIAPGLVRVEKISDAPPVVETVEQPYGTIPMLEKVPGESNFAWLQRSSAALHREHQNNEFGRHQAEQGVTQKAVIEGEAQYNREAEQRTAAHAKHSRSRI